MDEERFRRYVDAFNGARYDELGTYYADGVTLSFPDGTTLHGLDGITAFYRPVHADLREILEIDFLLIGEHALAAELYTEFHALRDTDAFPGRSLKEGDVLRFTSFVHYDIDEDDLFSGIRVARYREHDERYRDGR